MYVVFYSCFYSIKGNKIIKVFKTKKEAVNYCKEKGCLTRVNKHNYYMDEKNGCYYIHNIRNGKEYI